jgi:hypothetical protein
MVSFLLLGGCKPLHAPVSDLGLQDLRAPDLAPRDPNVLGRVVDDDGAPRSEVYCQLCSAEICLTGKTGQDGRIGFVATRTGSYHFHAFSDDPITYGDVFLPVPITVDPTSPSFHIDLGDHLIAPAVGPGQAVTIASGGTFSFPGGVSLEVPAGALRFDSGDPQGSLFALSVPKAKVAVQLLAARATSPDGIFLLLPYGATCDGVAGKGCGVVLPAGGLPDGTQVELTMPNATTAVLETVAVAAVSGQKLVVPATNGLPSLGWVILYKR